LNDDDDDDDDDDVPLSPKHHTAKVHHGSGGKALHILSPQVSGQFHALVALPPVKESTLPNG